MSPGEAGIVVTVLALLALAVGVGGFLIYRLLGWRRHGDEVTREEESGASEG